MLKLLYSQLSQVDLNRMNLTEEIKALDLGHSPNKSTMIEIFKLMRKTKVGRIFVLKLSI